jgi:hypothetical protein
MNEESLSRANAFLAAVAARVQPGQLLDASPAEIGASIGVAEPLAAARAVRALLARRRLEATEGTYRLLDATPLQPGEPEAIPRKRRARRKASAPEGGGRPGPATYSDVGRVAIDRLIELGREVGTLRASARTAKEEARVARQDFEEADKRARALQDRVHDLEGKLEMAEQNLRTLLAAAKGPAGAQKDEAVGTSEMEAILGVLKGSQEG